MTMRTSSGKLSACLPDVIFLSHFKYCSWPVKLKLFQSYCICFYNTALWNSHNKVTLARFVSCYNNCVKRFFGFPKYSKMSSALLQLGLPTCNTLLHNYKFRFCRLREMSSDLVRRVYLVVLCHVQCSFSARLLVLDI